MNQYTIALVEDDDPTAIYYKDELEKRIAKSNVIIFNTSDEAIKYLEDKKNDIDVFLLDYNLSGSTYNGLKTAFKIGEMFTHKEIKILYPCVVFTQAIIDEDDHKIISARRYKIPFIQKPIGNESGKWKVLVDTLIDEIERVEQDRINYNIKGDVCRLEEKVDCNTKELGEIKTSILSLDKKMSLWQFVKNGIKEFNDEVMTKENKWAWGMFTAGLGGLYVLLEPYIKGLFNNG